MCICKNGGKKTTTTHLNAGKKNGSERYVRVESAKNAQRSEETNVSVDKDV